MYSTYISTSHVTCNLFLPPHGTGVTQNRDYIRAVETTYTHVYTNPYVWISKVQLHKNSNHKHTGFLSQSHLSVKITSSYPVTQLLPSGRWSVFALILRWGKSQFVSGRAGPWIQLSSFLLALRPLFFHGICLSHTFPVTPTLLWNNLHTGRTPSPRPHLALCWSYPVPREHRWTVRNQVACRSVSWKTRGGEGRYRQRQGQVLPFSIAGAWERPVPSENRLEEWRPVRSARPS